MIVTHQQVHGEVVAFAVQLRRQIPKVVKKLALSLKFGAGSRTAAERFACAQVEDFRTEGGNRSLKETFVLFYFEFTGLLKKESQVLKVFVFLSFRKIKEEPPELN